MDKKSWNISKLKKSGMFMPVVGGVLLLSVLGSSFLFRSPEDARIAQFESKIASMKLSDILADPQLVDYATYSSRQLFVAHCASCHGEDGQGDKTPEGLFAPVLNDNDWLFEGKIDSIHFAIENGLKGNMPAYRKTLSSSQINSLSKYVQALSEGQPDREPLGKQLFMSKGCAGCHGEKGAGLPQIGAPNLADNIWRFDSSFEGIKRTITYGINSGEVHDRVAVMPKFKDTGKLTSIEIKKLAIYVSTLNATSSQRNRQ